jgi:cob(I)alamin adenosyltransferase
MIKIKDDMIYTKKGDDGSTYLSNGNRVSKDDIRIEINGEIDELNSFLGIAKCMLGETNSLDVALITNIQEMLMIIMSHIALCNNILSYNELDEFTESLEQRINTIVVKKEFQFVLPGSDIQSSLMHVVRTKARTVERRLCTLRKTITVNSSIMRFFNRISDYFFALAVKDYEVRFK